VRHPVRSCIQIAAIAGVAVLVAAAPAGASQRSWEPPLVGYWPLNEGRGQVARDWSGYGNHGQLGSTPGVDANDPTWIKGRFGLGHGLNFGGDDFVAIPDSDALEPSDITVATSFRGASSPGSYSYLVSKGGDGCEAGSYGLYTSKFGGLAFYVYDGTSWTRSPEADASVWDGRWHHAAGTYDGQTVRLFVDGRQIGSGTPAGSPIEYELPDESGAIGAYQGSCSLLFTGDLDEVRIWRRALPVSDIWDRARLLLALLRR
jgi:hypothetical protein